MERMQDARVGKRDIPRLSGPRALLDDVRFAPLWLLPRVTLGWVWLEAGWRLTRQAPAASGQAAFSAADASDLLATGMILVGISLILGVLTGPAAAVGGMLGLWAGGGEPLSALMVVAALALVMARKSAGWIGIDRWLLPLLRSSGRDGSATKACTEQTRKSGDRRQSWYARERS